MRKKFVLLVDFRAKAKEIDPYKRTYCFADEAKTNYHLTGFGSEAVQLLDLTATESGEHLPSR